MPAVKKTTKKKATAPAKKNSAAKTVTKKSAVKAKTPAVKAKKPAVKAKASAAGAKKSATEAKASSSRVTLKKTATKPAASKTMSPASKKSPTVKKKAAKPLASEKSTKKVTKAKEVMAEETSVEKPRKVLPRIKALPELVIDNAAAIGFMGIPPYDIFPDEEYMNDKQTAHFQHILLTWKRSLVEEMNRTVTHMKDEVINFPDLNDRASLEEEFSLELRTRDRERKLIKKIDEALFSITEDEYGFCETCGIEIGIRRLEARPTATQCIDCKTLAEIKEKQLKG